MSGIKNIKKKLKGFQVRPPNAEVIKKVLLHIPYVVVFYAVNKRTVTFPPVIHRDTVFSFTSSCINLFLSMVFQQTVFLCSYPDTAVQNKVEC